jgi:hypothetical protein
MTAMIHDEEKRKERKKRSKEVFKRLRNAFKGLEVKKEWDSAKKTGDDHTRAHYRPRLDFVIGPFNIDGKIHENNKAITGACKRFSRILRRMKSEDSYFHEHDFRLNDNPRCFLAIEMEDTNSEKHMIGSVVNASAMGKIGFVIGVDEADKKLKRIRDYLEFLKQVNKSDLKMSNLIILPYATFSAILDDCLR